MGGGFCRNEGGLDCAEHRFETTNQCTSLARYSISVDDVSDNPGLMIVANEGGRAMELTVTGL